MAAAGYEIYYTKAVDDSHIPKLNDTSFNTTVRQHDISVVFFFLPCKLVYILFLKLLQVFSELVVQTNRATI